MAEITHDLVTRHNGNGFASIHSLLSAPCGKPVRLPAVPEYHTIASKNLKTIEWTQGYRTLARSEGAAEGGGGWYARIEQLGRAKRFLEQTPGAP